MVETARKGPNTPNPDLRSCLEQVEILCNDCGACVKNCAFLQKYGTPGKLASDLAHASAQDMSIAFECSLCGLCTALCPKGCDPASLFFHMRCQVSSRLGDFKEHKGLRSYEAQGISDRYSYYALPRDCRTVFFPGCNLPGSRPEITRLLFQHLQAIIPNLGVVMDCCCKPSHDLGRTAFFQAMFGEMREYLLKNNIQKILCACPNCFKVFSMYGEGLEVEMVYTILDQQNLPPGENAAGQVCVHDPCPLRDETAIHKASRRIIRQRGLEVIKQRHEGKKTLCCGEGGAVPCMDRELAFKWPKIRVEETQGNPLITYCAGCALFLGRHTPTHHILDLIFHPQETMEGRAKPAPSPITYWNRTQLKKWFKQNLPAEAVRTRNALPQPFDGDTPGTGRRGALLAFVGGLLCGFKNNT